MQLSKKQIIIFNILAVICISLFCAGIAPKTLQNDTYYNIKIGEYVAQNGISDLTQDPFSWHNLPYTYPHWLYDLGMYIIYNNFGHPGVYASTIVLTCLLGLSLYMLCTKVSKNQLVSFIITLGAIYLMKSFIAARAQLITFLLFTLAVYSIEMFLETHKKRYAVFLIIIPLLIANLHCAVFPFYFILFLPYIAEFLLITIIDADLDKRLIYITCRLLKKIFKQEKLQAKFDKICENMKLNISERNKRRETLKENPYKIKVKKDRIVAVLIIVMAFALLTGFINPAGNNAYTYLYKTMQGNTTNSINEHQPMVLIQNREFICALVLFLSILIFTDTKIKLADLFMLIGLTYLTFQTKRQVTMFALFCAPILVKLISSMFEKYDKKTCFRLVSYASSWFGFIMVTSLFVIISVKMIKPMLNSNYVDMATYPVEASTWILDNLDVENIKLYDEYNFGSYLLFRGIPVFIDSRADLYSPEFNEDKENNIPGRDIFSDALNTAGLSVNYKDTFPKYGITHALMYKDAKLAMVMKDDPDYELIYNQGNFKIFVRLTPYEIIDN